MRRRCCLCSNICKWLDFRVFSEKDIKPSTLGDISVFMSVCMLVMWKVSVHLGVVKMMFPISLVFGQLIKLDTEIKLLLLLLLLNLLFFFLICAPCKKIPGKKRIKKWKQVATRITCANALFLSKKILGSSSFWRNISGKTSTAPCARDFRKMSAALAYRKWKQNWKIAVMSQVRMYL